MEVESTVCSNPPLFEYLDSSLCITVPLMPCFSFFLSPKMNTFFSLLLPVWVFCFAFVSSPSHARNLPLLAPISAPVPFLETSTISPQQQPIYPTSPTMPPYSAVMQMTAKDQAHHLNTGLLLVIILAPVVVGSLVLSSFCAWICWRRKVRKSDLSTARDSDVAKGLALGPIFSKFGSLKMSGKKGSASVIDYSLLEAATNNFSGSNILGEGGVGCVYMARFNDSFVAAVKRLDNGGQDSEREFENEINLMSGIKHPNLVSLLGYCVHGPAKMLIYEFVENGTLEEQLHGPSCGSALTWQIRMKIALDVARGLEYLHEHCTPPVIHRDLKSSNILLDSSFNVKISDFGLAVIVGSQIKSNIQILGSLGYVAPEYLLDGKLTEKSDVYAFGVILLELLVGRKPVEKMAPSQCQSIVTWAMPQLTDRSKLPNIVDPVIRNTMDLKHLYQVAAVAVLCVQPEPSYRPLITDVLHSLMPLVPVELGGALRITEPPSRKDPKP